ncbi:MAG TPA: hypothetical protein VIR54_06390 [Vicinamibacterales bacterium]|jgi:hypothetical protein
MRKQKDRVGISNRMSPAPSSRKVSGAFGREGENGTDRENE